MKFVSDSVNQWLRDTRHRTEMEPTSILMSKCIMPPPAATNTVLSNNQHRQQFPSSANNTNNNLNHSFAHSFIDIRLPGAATAAAAAAAETELPSPSATIRGPNYSSSEIVGFPQTELRSYDLSQSSACVFDPRLSLSNNNRKQLSAATMSHHCSVVNKNDSAQTRRRSEGEQGDNNCQQQIPIWLEQSQDELILSGKIPIGEFDDEENDDNDPVNVNVDDYETGEDNIRVQATRGSNNKELNQTLAMPGYQPRPASNTTTPLRFPVPPTPVTSSSPSLFKVTKSTINRHNPSCSTSPQKYPLLSKSLPKGNGGSSRNTNCRISPAPVARQESSITPSTSSTSISFGSTSTNLTNDRHRFFSTTITPTSRQQQKSNQSRLRGEARNDGRKSHFSIQNDEFDTQTTRGGQILNAVIKTAGGDSIVHYARPIRIVSRQQEQSLMNMTKTVVHKNIAVGNTDFYHPKPMGHEEDDSGIFNKESGDNSSLDSLSPSMCYSSEESGNPPHSSSLPQQTGGHSSSDSAPFGNATTIDAVNNNPNNSKTPLLLMKSSSSSFSSSSHDLIISMKDSDHRSNVGMYEQSKDTIGGLLSLCSQIFNETPQSGGGGGGGIDANLIGQYFRIIDALPFSESLLPQDELLALKSKFDRTSSDECQEQDVTNVDVRDGIRWVTDKCFEHISKTLLYEIAGGRDLRNVEGALKDFAHMALLSETVSLYIIQLGGIQFLVSLCREMEAKPTTLRLALRALAILCGLPKGCIQLLSMGGLDMVLAYLLHSNQEDYAAVSVEAAGVLTQLTAPSHSFATLPKSLPEIVQRLLDLCDWSKTCETFLLCVGSLGNLSLHHSSVSHYLYRYQGPLRLVRALSQQGKTQSTYIFDQIATILSRVSVNGFDDCLIAQGAIPWLLRLLQTRDARHKNLAKSVRYKAAISLGSIASRSAGLKAIHKANGTTELRNALELSSFLNNADNNNNNNGTEDCPTETIARSLLSRLTDKYQLETVV